MSVIYIVLPLAILFAAAAVGVFIVAVRRGQFDDLDTPAVRMLLDDEEPPVEGPEARERGVGDPKRPRRRP